MSTAVLSNEAVLVGGGALQPFRCVTCLKRFTRLENLKRHAAVHQEGNSFPCAHCKSSFSRNDLRRRHVVKKHPNHSAKSTSPNGTDKQPPIHVPPVTNANMTADLESILSVSVSGGSFPSESPPIDPSSVSISFPTFHTEDYRFDFEPIDYRPAPAKGTGDTLLKSSSSPSTPSTTSFDLLTQEEICLGTQLCEIHVLPYIPFVHRSTFPQDTPDTLVLSLFSLGFHHAADVSNGQRLAEECYRSANRMLELSNSYKPIVIVQSLLVLQIYAIMFACGEETTNGLRMRARGVEIARREGLMDPLPGSLGIPSNLASLWKHFVRAETHKRTLFFLYQLDSTWYHLLSVPRAVSHLEIKHDLPCSESIWDTETAEEWAHRKLVDGEKDPVRFIQVVRACMAFTTSAVISSSFNALLLCLYLQSSVREVSGWSTMTGRLCLERFEALKSALLTLEPSKLDAKQDAPYASDAEAAWRITLIELVLWNPSHTNGLVELSLDGAIASAVSLSTAQLSVMTPQVAELLEPHLTWFLLYLEEERTLAAEAPWVTVYAFKAVLIAWQLARAGLLNSVQKLGISDSAGLATWIRAVFRERSHWGAGRLIMNSLEEL